MKKAIVVVSLGLLWMYAGFAEEIMMSCKAAKYKYITKDSGNIILYTHKKRDRGKWAGWCPSEVTEDNKAWFVSASDHNLIVSDLRGVCMVSEGKFKMADGKVGIVKSNTTVTDFKKLTVTSTFYWMDKKEKITVKDKCKKVKM